MSRTIREDYYGWSSRDKKKWYKPPGWWKRLRRRIRRHIIKQAMRAGRMLPRFKKSDIWEWN